MHSLVHAADSEDSMVVRPLFLALLSLSLCVNARLAAQTVGNAAPPRCSNSGRFVRAGAGAVLGAWLGFVGAKIKQSDWNAESRSAAAHRSRNRATAGGALLGVTIGGAPFWGRSCGGLRSASGTSALGGSSHRPITREEIARFGVQGNVFDLVYSLRRNWLNVRGEDMVPGEAQLVVYLNNSRLGTFSELRGLPAAGVTGVRYFDAAEATFRWGAGHMRGAIEVLTTSDPVPASANPSP
jgi:hypothetical protein